MDDLGLPAFQETSIYTLRQRGNGKSTIYFMSMIFPTKNTPFIWNPSKKMCLHGGAYIINGGTPIAGWFIIENPMKRVMTVGYPHDLGNLHMGG